MKAHSQWQAEQRQLNTGCRSRWWRRCRCVHLTATAATGLSTTLERASAPPAAARAARCPSQPRGCSSQRGWGIGLHGRFLQPQDGLQRLRLAGARADLTIPACMLPPHAVV